MLAEKFGISRASVREAIRILDAMGLVRSSTGSGPTAGATEKLSAPLLLNPEALLLCGLMWADSDHPTSSTVCEVLTANDFYDEVTVVDIMQEVADQDPGLEQ